MKRAAIFIACLFMVSGCGAEGLLAGTAGFLVGSQQDGGADAVDGTDGQSGLDGADGLDGNDGADGADGADGLDGNDGVDGIDGADGNDGADGAGGTGQPGQDGADGADGEIRIIIVDEDGEPVETGKVCVQHGEQELCLPIQAAEVHLNQHEDDALCENPLCEDDD